MNNMATAVLLAWTKMGITLDKEVETDTSYTIYISVPEHSFERDVHGVEMAGTYLARRIKQILTEMGVKNLVVKAKIRKGDTWTKEKAELAYNRKGREIYRSQWEDDYEIRTR